VNEWINLAALWKIAVIGLVLGAGLPVLFAVGLRVLGPRPAQGAAGGEGGGAVPVARAALAVFCFATVLAAIGWGIYSIVASN